MRLVKELFHATLEEAGPTRRGVRGRGIGKSRLGWEFVKYIDGISDPVRWHRGRCLSYGDGSRSGRSPRWCVAGSASSRATTPSRSSTSWTPAGHMGAGRGRTHLAAPPARGAAGGRRRLRPRCTTRSDDLLASWQLFFERLAESGEAVGVALLIEDLQWADDGLLDFIEQLLERSRAPIFVLALARSELAERRPTWASGRRATSLYLEPLPPATMGGLVDGLVDGLPPRPGTRWSSARKASRSSRSRRCALSSTATRWCPGRSLSSPTTRRRRSTSPPWVRPPACRPCSPRGSTHCRRRERRTVQNAAVLGLSFTRAALGHAHRGRRRGRPGRRARRTGA